MSAFHVFLSAQSHVLQSFPQDLVPLARNHSSDGYVSLQAEYVAEQLDRPWIARDARPTADSLCSSKVRTMAGGGNKVAITAEGAVAVSADSKHLYVWKVSSGELLQKLEPDLNEISMMSLTGDGRIAALAEREPDLFGGRGARICVWDIHLGVCLRVLDAEGDSVRRIALSGDGSRAGSVDRHGTVRVWDIESGAGLLTRHGHVNCVALSEDGKTLLSGDEDGSISVWDTSSGELIHRLARTSGPVVDLSVARDGQRALAAGKSSLHFWDISSETCLCEFGFPAGGIEHVAMTPDGRMGISIQGGRSFFSGNQRWTIPNRLNVYDLESGEHIRTLAAGVKDAAITADGRIVISADGEDLHVWDVVAGDKDLDPDRLNQEEVAATEAMESPDGRLVLVPSFNTIRVTDVVSGESRSLQGHTDDVTSVASSPDGSLAVSGSFDGTVRVWQPSSGVCLRQKKGGYGSVVAFGADGRLVVSGRTDVGLWDLESDRSLLTIPELSNAGDLLALALTPDDKILVSSHSDSTVRVWRLAGDDGGPSAREDGEVILSAPEDPLQTLTQHHESVISIALTPDGRKAVSASFDTTLRVWDLASGACLHVLAGHSAEARRVMVTRDGRTAVSASNDRTLRAWDLSSGSCACIYHAAGKVVSLSDIRPDGEFTCVTTGNQIQPLTLRNIKQEPPLVTAVRLFRFDIPHLEPPLGSSGDAPLYEQGQPMPGRYDANITARCPWCRQHHDIPRSVKSAIDGLMKGLTCLSYDSPCLFLHEDAWKEPRLAARCPSCHRPLRFNPFFVDHGGPPRRGQS